MDNPIVSISLDERGRLRMQLTAATEMKFSLALDGLDYDRVFEDVCNLCPILIRMDAEIAELFDGDLDREPSAEDTEVIAEFVRRYRAALLDVEVGVDAFMENLYA